MSVPFNIDLLDFNDRLLTLVRKINSLDIFDGATKNFHKDGLYSTDIFGQVGTQVRSEKFAYIDVKLNILHPLIYRRLIKMRGFYGDIMSSKEFAIFDEDKKDFVKSNALEGQTGYEFFVSRYEDITFDGSTSNQRAESVKLIDKYKKKAFTSKLIVIPAAYRDLEIDEFGKQSTDEVNDLYMKALATANTINERVAQMTPEAYDRQRYTLQKIFIQIYETFEKLLDGKESLLLSKWAGRNIYNGTRNVITAMKSNSQYLGGKGSPNINNTCVGIYQTIKGILPITKYLLKNGFLSTVFTSASAPALLCDKKTLNSVRVNLKHNQFDDWMTGEGLEKIINTYAEESIRHDPVEVAGYYIGLIYKGDDETFKLIHGIDELPEGYDKSKCTPITLTELFYCSIYHTVNKYPLLVTRYPIAGMGSIYSSFVFLESTIKYETRSELGEDWKPIGEDRVAYRFPTNTPFFNSMSPHDSRLVGLAADFDGDTSSGNYLITEEAIAENKKLINSRAFYVGTDGKFYNNLETDTVKYVTHNLTCGKL